MELVAALMLALALVVVGFMAGMMYAGLQTRNGGSTVQYPAPLPSPLPEGGGWTTLDDEQLFFYWSSLPARERDVGSTA